MNVDELMKKYRACVKRGWSVCRGRCLGCDLDMPEDVYEACRIITEYTKPQ